MTEDKKKPLNIRQKKYIDNRIKGMTQEKAYKEAGYKGGKNDACRLEKELGTNGNSMAKALEEAGVTPEKMAERLNEELDAEESKWNPAEKRWDNMVSHGSRAKGIELAGKFRGDFVEKKELSVTGMEGLRFVIEGLDDIEEVETKD